MKKIGILLLVIVASTAFQSAYGQAELALGIKGGLNFANVNTSSAGAAFDSRTGYHAGAFFLMKFGKIGIQPELIYSAQGTKVKYSTGQSFDSNFSYVNIPVILKLYLIGGLNLQAGPQFGFLTSAEGPKVVNGNLTTGDIKDQLKGSDISIGLGAGWDLPFGLNVDVRYNLGVSDNNNNSGSSESIKNQVIQASVGFKLIKFGK